mgnify:CR=1 FL=1
MKIIEPSARIITGYDRRPEELIELCGRICYDSQDKIANGTAQKFCEKLRKSGHTSVFEHANFIFAVTFNSLARIYNGMTIYEMITGKPSYIRISGRESKDTLSLFYVSGNARAWINFITVLNKDGSANRHIPHDIIKTLSQYHSIFADIADVAGANAPARQIFPEQLPQDVWERHTTATFFITCDRGISHELVRHRAASFSQQSTRYCKANNDGEIEIIKPSSKNTVEQARWAFDEIEWAYDNMLVNGTKPQTARCILPTCLATRLYMTMTIERWRDFLALRTSPAAHPDMRVIAEQIQAQLFG